MLVQARQKSDMLLLRDRNPKCIWSSRILYISVLQARPIGFLGPRYFWIKPQSSIITQTQAIIAKKSQMTRKQPLPFPIPCINSTQIPRHSSAYPQRVSRRCHSAAARLLLRRSGPPVFSDKLPSRRKFAFVFVSMNIKRVLEFSDFIPFLSVLTEWKDGRGGGHLIYATGRGRFPYISFKHNKTF